MRIEMVGAQDIGAEHRQLWDAFQSQDRALASPFFSLEFAQAAARLRPTTVAVIEVDNRIRGFWAFERRRMGLAVPAGFPIADHHGPVVNAELEVSTAKLLRACRCQLFWFGGLPARQQLFQHFHRATEDSPIVHLDRLKPSDQRRKWRRLEREVGEVRFELNCQDPRVLDRLIAWKRDQCARTQFADPFADPWTGSFVRELHRTQTVGLRGWLSVLWAGDKPMAAHFGLLSRRVWHWWYPAYDPEYARHSPGLLMLSAMLEAAPALGIEWLDFGPGAEDFKWRLANDALPIAYGTAFTPIAGIAIGMKRRVEGALHGTRLHRAMRRAVDWFGHGGEAVKCERRPPLVDQPPVDEPQILRS